MTEQQVFDELAAHLPPDAAIFVDRIGWHSRNLDLSVSPSRGWWMVRIVHKRTGYERKHSVKADTPRGAIDAALAKWHRHQSRREQVGVPDRVKVGEHVWRVRVPAQRLFYSDAEGPREYSHIIRPAERRIDIAGCVPRNWRPFVLRCAAESAGKAQEQPRRAA
jgi:hypothetical protein